MNKNAKAKNVLQGLPSTPAWVEGGGVRSTGTASSIINELKMMLPPRTRASATQKARLGFGTGRPPCIHSEQETRGKVQTLVAVTFHFPEKLIKTGKELLKGQISVSSEIRCMQNQNTVFKKSNYVRK